MKLRRYAPGQRVPGWRVSAWWEFEDYPGLFVFQESRLEVKESGRTGTLFWYFAYSWIDHPNSLLIGKHVFPRLKNQSFPTRREALQALEMALALVEAETGN